MFEDAEKKPTPPPVPGGQADSKPAEKESSSEESVHTMPMDYYLGDKTAEASKGATATPPTPAVPDPTKPVQPGKPAKKAGSKKGLNIILIVVGVIVIGASAWLLYLSFRSPVPPQSSTGTTETQAPVVADEVVPEPEADVVDEVIEEDVVEEEDIEVEEAEEDVVDIFNPSDINEISLSLLGALDTDNDGLTDSEEALIGTDFQVIDSDEDTYIDREEINNMYSPLQAGEVRLWDEDFVSYYNNSEYNYRVLYPAGWLIQPLDEDKPNDLMISSNQNEFVNILVEEKLSSETLEEWYLDKAPSVLLGSLKQYSNYSDLDVLESPDGFTAYLQKENQVYIINYNIGLKEEANFPAIFAMIINSFEFIEE